MAQNESQKRYYEKNKKEICRKRREHYHANIPKARAYYKKNANKLNAQSQKYRAENKESIKVNKLTYRKRRLKELMDYDTNYYYNNRDDILPRRAKLNKGKPLKYRDTVNANNRKKYADDPVFKAQCRARTKCANAIKEGVLVRPKNCDRCKKKCKPEAHHDDYNKPLSVRWLCVPCHRFTHRKENPLN